MESGLEDAVWLGGVIDFSAVGLDHGYAAGRFFDDVIYACEAKDVV